MTPYDWLLARRTVSLALALALLAFAVMLGTDDSASTVAGRIGRLSALLSLAGGGAAFIATEQARSRGEMRALGAAGVPPVKASLGAVVGGAAIGAVGAVLALLRRVDLTPLFPRVAPSSSTWVSRGDAWLDVARGIAVRASGELSLVAAEGGASLTEAPVHRGATAASLVLASVAFPLWATARSSGLRRAAAGFAIAAGSVTVFHLVAAERATGWLLALPPLALLLEAFSLHRGASWR
jgi:hypothetical protein